jgi:hypothetical protein
MEPITGTFHDAETGETIVRELTQEEQNAITQYPNVLPETSNVVAS